MQKMLSFFRSRIDQLKLIFVCLLQTFKMNRLFILVFFLSISIALKAQNAAMAVRIDSIENAIKQAENGLKPVLMLELAKAQSTFSPQAARSTLYQLLNSKNDKLQPEQQMLAFALMVDLYEKEGVADSARYYFLQAAQLAKAYQPIDSMSLPESFAKKNASSGSLSIQQVSYYLFAGLVFLVLALALMLLLQKKKYRNLIKARQNALDQLKAQEQESASRIEQEIASRTAELMEKVEEGRMKDAELKKALKRAEDANYLKNAFLSNMSHEIRMPLNGIIGFSSLLETELSLLENKELYDYATGIQQSGDRLLNLINNIIDISRIESNDIEADVHECSLNEILQNVFDLKVFSANEKGLNFKSKLNELPPILADNSKLMQVFHIVIDNAIKYTESGFVTITSFHEPETNMAIVRVKDTGEGIDDDYQKYLFDAFRQESSGYGRAHQGAGLGLPLAKRLLLLMGGSIHIESRRGVGTMVEIKVPCRQTAASGQIQPAKPLSIPIPNAPSIGKLDIFIVEDDRMNRMVLQKILSKAGHLTIAVDGDETIKIIRERQKKGHIFQVMLFDINLPSPWNGIILMQKIRETYPEYRYVPFIAQTAYAMAGDKEKMLEAGFDDYIAKPINKNELMTIIKNQLDKFSGMK